MTFVLASIVGGYIMRSYDESFFSIVDHPVGRATIVLALSASAWGIDTRCPPVSRVIAIMLTALLVYALIALLDMRFKKRPATEGGA